MSSETVSAYLLHLRQFKENQAICELFTLENGRESAVYRLPGASKKRSSSRLRPQLFQLYDAHLLGRSELKTVTHLEVSGARVALQQTELYCGLYLNELLMRLLHKEDPYTSLFAHYGQALSALEKGQDQELALRRFELSLLQELGYGISFGIDANGEAIANTEQSHYFYQSNDGFLPCNGDIDDKRRHLVFDGATLANIASGDIKEARTRLACKRICRHALGNLLGGKPLKSRELFM